MITLLQEQGLPAQAKALPAMLEAHGEAWRRTMNRQATVAQRV